MKFNKKILVIVCNVVLLNIANQCFASTNDNTRLYSKNGENYIDKIYSVEQNEENQFIENIENEIQIDGNKYIYTNKNIENTDTIDKKDIETTKKITLKTNNRQKIIDELGKTMEYNENGYIGTYTLDIDTIKIEPHNNGYYDKLIDTTIEYKDLEKNDLDYIPKQVIYKGKKLDLLKTKWEETENKLIGNATIGTKYKAICYYATKERVYNPTTYTITADYKGIAEKKVEKPLKITLSYIQQKNDEPQIVEEKNINPIPILGGTSSLIVFLGGLMLFMKNVKIYNYQNGKWRYIGKTLLLKGKIRLDRFTNKEVTNKYRIELTKSQSRKYNNKTITISKGKNSCKQIIHSNNESVDFEVRL